MLSPAVQVVMEEFNTDSKTFATFVVSIFVLGFACGPLLLAPLSELYGRVIIYNITNLLFLGFTIGCALSQNQSMLLAFRFLSGFAGVATITIGSGTIADLMPREKRGKAVSIWSVGTILGPMIGPIIGGYVTQVAGWRWMFWAISIVVSNENVDPSDARLTIVHHWSGRGSQHICVCCPEGNLSCSVAGKKGSQTQEANRQSELQVETRSRYHSWGTLQTEHHAAVQAASLLSNRHSHVHLCGRPLWHAVSAFCHILIRFQGSLRLLDIRSRTCLPCRRNWHFDRTALHCKI